MRNQSPLVPPQQQCLLLRGGGQEREEGHIIKASQCVLLKDGPFFTHFCLMSSQKVFRSLAGGTASECMAERRVLCHSFFVFLLHVFSACLF